jgi:asparagine synthase (glutamine-hydrolysing)
MSYRGPDSSGEWVSGDGQVGFAHRRLSILDLSPLGHQPMTSSSGRYTITFNGEVFNFSQIAQEMGFQPRGGSDTEVMLAAFEGWGVLPAVSRFVGMFAFAVWDQESRTVTLVRDRLGIKPLYYGLVNGSFVFTSDLRALGGFPGFSAQRSPEASALFLQYGYVPAPWSIFSSLWKLGPGAALTVSLDALTAGRVGSVTPFAHPPSEGIKYTQYWLLPDEELTADRCSEEELLEELESRLVEAIRLRLIADVPLGAFLSGGIDSSLVVALMRQAAGGRVRTFSVGFEVDEYNEAPYAKAVAQHLGTDHTELIVTAQTARDVVPLLQGIVDEPFADSSLIPTYLVSQLARRHVTVSLSGDGGDELFGGYNRYALLNKLMALRNRVPGVVSKIVGSSAELIPVTMISMLGASLHAIGLFPYDLLQMGEKARRTLTLVGIEDDSEFYYTAVRIWRRGEDLIPCVESVPRIASEEWRRDPRICMARADLHSYLPDDILTKVDRASMAVSLETRVPLLDHRVVEFASTLPAGFLYRDGRGKWPLRSLLAKYLPQDLINRPKRGFSVPMGDWLRGDLRDWAEELVRPQALEENGIAEEPVLSRWQQHQSGRRDFSQELWNVLMFQDWCRATRA